MIDILNDFVGGYCVLFILCMVFKKSLFLLLIVCIVKGNVKFIWFKIEIRCKL